MLFLFKMILNSFADMGFPFYICKKQIGKEYEFRLRTYYNFQVVQSRLQVHYAVGIYVYALAFFQ